MSIALLQLGGVPLPSKVTARPTKLLLSTRKDLIGSYATFASVLGEGRDAFFCLGSWTADYGDTRKYQWNSQIQK